MRASLPILRFLNAAAFAAWLAAESRSSIGAWLMLAKTRSGLVSLTRAEAVDTALCHGWIDGQQDRYDEANWLVRFTPRKRGSRWSQINRTRAIELIEAGSMRSAGLAEVEAAQADGRWDAAYAPASTIQIPPDLKTALDASPEAEATFAALSKAARYAILFRICNVKKPETRIRIIRDYIVAWGVRDH